MKFILPAARKALMRMEQRQRTVTLDERAFSMLDDIAKHKGISRSEVIHEFLLSQWNKVK